MLHSKVDFIVFTFYIIILAIFLATGYSFIKAMILILLGVLTIFFSANNFFRGKPLKKEKGMHWVKYCLLHSDYIIGFILVLIGMWMAFKHN